jgi:hypothetical protein
MSFARIDNRIAHFCIRFVTGRQLINILCGLERHWLNVLIVKSLYRQNGSPFTGMHCVSNVQLLRYTKLCLTPLVCCYVILSCKVIFFSFFLLFYYIFLFSSSNFVPFSFRSFQSYSFFAILILLAEICFPFFVYISFLSFSIIDILYKIFSTCNCRNTLHIITLTSSAIVQCIKASGTI